MRIEVDWFPVSEHGPEWEHTRLLYAIAEPDSSQIVYIGKADGSTLRQRWKRVGSKEELWNWYETTFGTRRHLFLVGDVLMLEGTRLTRELLADIESLLINRVKPMGNIQYRDSRSIFRPGLVVECVGVWPKGTRRFVDGRSARR